MTREEFDFWKSIYAASVASGKRLTEARGNAEAALIDYRIEREKVEEVDGASWCDPSRDHFYYGEEHDYPEQA
jgi:hypothetical protein